MSSPAQLKAIYTLLRKNGIKDKEDKESIVEVFTGKRTGSVTAMKDNEAAALIGHLKSMEPTETSATKMRNKILSMCHEMNWTIPGTGKVDMDHVNNWCISKSYLKKKLDDYEYNELPKLVSQVEEVYKSYLKGK